MKIGELKKMQIKKLIRVTTNSYHHHNNNHRTSTTSKLKSWEKVITEIYEQKKIAISKPAKEFTLTYQVKCDCRFSKEPTISRQTMHPK